MSRFHSVSRGQDSAISVLSIPALLSIFLFIGPGAVSCLAQASVEEFRNTLSAKAGLTGDEWSALERGEMIVKRLPVANKREVAVFGVARLQGTPEVIMKAFKESMTQQNSKSILATGKLSDPPTLADVETLSLEDRDIEDLKQCVVGKCELKLSAAMIERFQKEMNWTAPDYQHQATRLFREMLLDYVRDYQIRRDAALIEYHDQRRAVSMREEQQALLDRLLYVPDFAPEVASYLKSFPHSELSNIENHINWIKIKFGLKPVIIVTHVVTYERPNKNQTLSVSKQIYANHYFDSSLALTAVMSIPTSAGGSYLIYTNDSRSDSLAGSFSRIRRGLVESQSIENLNALLLQTRANVKVASANQSGSIPPARKNPISEWLFRETRLYWWLIGGAVLIAMIVFGRRNLRRMQGRARRADPSTSEGSSDSRQSF